LKVDTQKIVEKITDFISSYIKKSGLKGAVVTVSGGIDSAVALALTVKALGSEKVRAVTMPERDITPEGDITDVMQLAEALDVTCDTVEITPVIDVMKNILPLYDQDDQTSSGNLKPRVRMTIAYHYANSLDYMVISSSNKSEWMTGYFTKHGDGAVDLMPLGDLYKCQIGQIARYLKIPDRILEKTPTAGLWPGQTDEGEIGASYDEIDLILYGRGKGLTAEDIAKRTGIDFPVVEKILRRVDVNEHKRRIPLILRFSSING
ncbi:MAG: NAD+ synthase, partial [Candidatus Bathyarchaeota archaeon]